MAIRVNGQLLDEREIAEEQRLMLPHLVEAMPGEPRTAVLARAKEWAQENAIERALLRQAAIADPEPVSEADLASTLAQLGSKPQPSACLQTDSAVVPTVADSVPGENQPARLPEGTEPGTDSAVPAMTEAEIVFRVERLKTRVAAKLLPPKSKEIGEHYKKNASRFCAPEMVRVAHIVRNVDERTDESAALASIQEIARKLELGGDFAQLADEFSDCPGQGGDLGFFSRGEMVPEFERVVFSLSPGQVSQPFRTPFGFHIAKLIEYRPPRALQFAEVRDQIAESLFAAKRARAVERYLDQLRSCAVISVDIE